MRVGGLGLEGRGWGLLLLLPGLCWALGVERCERRIRLTEDVSEWRLSGSLRPTLLARRQFCSLKLQAPIGSRLRLTFSPLSSYASDSAVVRDADSAAPSAPSLSLCPDAQHFLIFQDGWSAGEVGRGRRSLSGERSLLCDTPAKAESSRNIAELLYRLPSDVSLRVELLREPQPCNVYLSAAEFAETYTLTAEKRRCRWHLPGRVEVSVQSATFVQPPEDGAQCSPEGSFFRGLAGRDPEKLKTWAVTCRAGAQRLRLPCKFSAVELSSAAGEAESVTFTVRPLHTDIALLMEPECT